MLTIEKQQQEYLGTYIILVTMGCTTLDSLIILERYSVVNWIPNVKDSKSISGYVFMLVGAVVA